MATHHALTLDLDIAPVELTPEALEAADRSQLLTALEQLGTDVNEMATGQAVADEGFDIVPMRDGWLRLGASPDGRLEAGWIADPRDPGSLLGETFLLQEAELDLNNLSLYRIDLDEGADHWLNVFRLHHREAYVAVGYRRDEPEPSRQGVVAGLYPDALVAGAEGNRIVFVQPDPERAGRTQAVVALLSGETEPEVVTTGDAAEISLAPTARRRWVTVEWGPRRSRHTGLLDVDAESPAVVPIELERQSAALVQVGSLEERDTLFVVVAGEQGWELYTSPLEPLPRSFTGAHLERLAEGHGTPFALAAGVEQALVGVRTKLADGGAEDLVLGVALPSGEVSEVRRSPGLLRLQSNTTLSRVGFSLVERVGARGITWFHSPDGAPLGGDAVGSDVPLQRGWGETTSRDGFRVRVDARWYGEDSTFRGPVALMLYGAYGLDLDLDSDPQLLEWLDRGWAVAAAQVRGGAGERHRQAIGSLRENSLADAEAVVRWLRSADGGIQADPLVVLGASAGGLQASVVAARCPDAVDAVIVVNGYVDPLGELQAAGAATAQADRNEWGDPEDPEVRRVLSRLSGPGLLARMAPAPAPAPRALVIVCGRDVRVDPRRGVAWALRYRALGHRADLWYDPLGTHDQWGEGCPPGALVEWAAEVLDLRCPEHCRADHTHRPLST